tara:strand:+ start:782 stop:991 length:210 start_codon:yes stop_codon:yes gene_type:complete
MEIAVIIMVVVCIAVGSFFANRHLNRIVDESMERHNRLAKRSSAHAEEDHELAEGGLRADIRVVPSDDV